MEDIDFSKVGMKMKQLRMESGFTQEKAAQDLGCTVAFISNIENNRAKINLRVLLYYAGLCNVSADTLLNAGKAEEASDCDEDERFDELRNLFRMFSAEEQKKIIRMMRIWISV